MIPIKTKATFIQNKEKMTQERWWSINGVLLKGSYCNVFQSISGKSYVEYNKEVNKARLGYY